MKTGFTGHFGGKGWIMIIYTMMLFMISSVGADAMNIIFPALVAFKGWSYSGLLALSIPGTFIIAFFIAIAGAAIQKKGAKYVTLILLPIASISWVLVGFAPTFISFAIVFTLMCGTITTINLCSAQTFVSNWFPRKKGIALGWATVGLCLSGVLLVPMFNFMINNGGNSIAPPCIVIAVIIMILFIFTLAWVRNTPEEVGYLPDNEPLTEEAKANLLENLKGIYTTKELFKTKQTWLIIIGFSFFFMGLLGIVMMIIPRLTAVGLSQNTATLMFTIATVIGIIGSVLWGVIDQKIGTKSTNIIFGILWTLMLFLSGIFSYFNNPIGSVISVILFASLFGGLPNLFPSTIIWIFGRYDFAVANKVISSFVSFVRNIGLIIVSVMMGMFTALNIGLGYSYLILSGFSLIGLICVIALNRKGIKSVDTAHVSR